VRSGRPCEGNSCVDWSRAVSPDALAFEIRYYTEYDPRALPEMQYRQNFRSLEAFEAVSRHLSVSAAAAELGVTQSAISHQLRLLSDLVGERLLQKQGRGIALTEAGERLARNLQPAFADIVRSVGDAIGGTRSVVRLAICSSFGPAWLVPRLEGFYATQPSFDLQLCMYARDPKLTDAVADAFVTTLPNEKGFEAVLLWAEKLVPVVAATADSAAEPALITTDLEPGRHGADWNAYAALSGCAVATDTRWLFASHYLIALEMVKAGLGAALVPDFLAARDLQAGTVRQLHDAALPTHQDYYLCVKESRRGEPALDALIRWFKSQLPRQRKTNGNGTVPVK